MSDQPKCSQCGAPLAADVPGRLCLRCLLEFGLKCEADAAADEIPPALVETDAFPGYQLLEKIGEGGCGIVYRAAQLQPLRREVAIKVIKLGMDTRSVITHFEAERQALALMDHPGIARVFDAGVTGGGRPFFVMELVSGERITDYCDRKQLSVPQRLELFLQVCQAIQHAHQKGIIHRDLKPSNILVMEQDGKPVPKVIDFGIAKAVGQQRLADWTIYTVFDQFVGTPAYMSPEQAGLTGEDIDTRSDIYSLGILLYELLTGRPPFEHERLRRAALGEICRIIREEEPALPSARLTTLTQAELTETAQRRLLQGQRLVSELRGDLDWLVMKSLEKDRERRYDTANGLAADILRHLHNEPISARPPSALYRFQKFAKRNRAAVAAIATVSVVLIAGTVISTLEAIHARRAETQARNAETEARREAATSAQVQKFLERIIISARPGEYPRQDVTVLKSIMDRLAREAKSEFTNQPDVLADLLFNLGLTYGQLNDNARAFEVLRDAADAAGKLNPPDYNYHAVILEYLAFSIRHLQGDDDAVEIARQAMALRRRAPGAKPVDLNSSISFQILADIPCRRGELDTAKQMAEEFADAREKKYGLNHDTAESLYSLASVLLQRDEVDEAEATVRRSLAIQLGIKGPRDNIVAIPRNYCLLGAVLRRRGQLDEAEKMFRAANDFNHNMGQPDYPDALLELARLADSRHQTNSADQYFRAALDLNDGTQPVQPAARVAALCNYATFRRHIGDVAGANDLIERARVLTLKNTVEPSSRLLLGLAGSAQSWLAAGNRTNAGTDLNIGMEMAMTVRGSLGDFTIGPFLTGAAQLELQAGNTNAARQIQQQFEAALKIRLAALEKSGGEPSCLLIRQLAQAAGLDETLGDPAAAETRYQQATRFSRRLTYANSDIQAAYNSYARFLESQNRPDEAAALVAEISKKTAVQKPH